MANLSTLLSERLSPLTQETNLETGEIVVFHPGNEQGNFRCNICWRAPAAGQAIIEIWGASGSGGKMCCCGAGVPGNPGGYSKKTVSVGSGSFVSGIVGQSCGNADTLCWRGCSQSTCITVCHTGGCVCLCAEGGFGGRVYCVNGSSNACCLMANFGMCGTQLASSGCFTVCNNPCFGRAYGGDVNKCGGWSCSSFFHCNPCCKCSTQDHVAVAPGIFGQDGAVLTIQRERETVAYQCTGDGVSQLLGALSLAGRSPSAGGHQAFCWSSGRGCACYQAWGCQAMLPYGVGGLAGTGMDSNIMDFGLRGGHGAVRIKFIGS